MSVKIETIVLINQLELVKNPFIFKVTTIKKKFVDQMPVMLYSEMTDHRLYKIIGRADSDDGAGIIARHNGTGKFIRIHDRDLLEHLINQIAITEKVDMTKTEIWKEKSVKANQMLRDLPQIFKD